MLAFAFFRQLSSQPGLGQGRPPGWHCPAVESGRCFHRRANEPTNSVARSSFVLSFFRSFVRSFSLSFVLSLFRSFFLSFVLSLSLSLSLTHPVCGLNETNRTNKQTKACPPSLRYQRPRPAAGLKIPIQPNSLAHSTGPRPRLFSPCRLALFFSFTGQSLPWPHFLAFVMCVAVVGRGESTLRGLMRRERERRVVGLGRKKAS